MHQKEQTQQFRQETFITLLGSVFLLAFHELLAAGEIDLADGFQKHSFIPAYDLKLWMQGHLPAGSHSCLKLICSEQTLLCCWWLALLHSFPFSAEHSPIQAFAQAINLDIADAPFSHPLTPKHVYEVTFGTSPIALSHHELLARMKETPFSLCLDVCLR